MNDEFVASAASVIVISSYYSLDYVWYYVLWLSGCAPPPGTYDVKSGELKGAASFHKAERFRTATKSEGRFS